MVIALIPDFIIETTFHVLNDWSHHDLTITNELIIDRIDYINAFFFQLVHFNSNSAQNGDLTLFPFQRTSSNHSLFLRTYYIVENGRMESHHQIIIITVVVFISIDSSIIISAIRIVAIIIL